MRALAIGLAFSATAATACGGSDGPGRTAGESEAASPGRPTEIRTPAPPGTDRGRSLVAASGCLGCHRVGSSGNVGPGPNLTRIGRRLIRRQIERTLVAPEAPMPSYRGQAARDRAEIVRYLAALK
jgi:mono/diheme cytochrome c family protein